ncbi:hypothetical protein FE394_18955 [Xenorhabdus sp. Reich]|uniref:Uncharacterized protein n=1 Tax=Xenorhabdus littoralis TaxID=2582835 RepID=A0ABU4SR97_9GAMM|nr:hypothetical protein [Xenorhabdus sp. Reich]
MYYYYETLFSGKYSLESKVTLISGNHKSHPYTDKGIKFNWWIKKPLNANTKGISLSRNRDVYVGTDGSLKADLISTLSTPQETDVEVCVNVVKPIEPDREYPRNTCTTARFGN